MSIMRTQKSREIPYVMLNKTALNDGGLSFMAKGLHAYLMSKPDDWRISLKQLEHTSPKEGRLAVRKAMQELENAGYLTRKATRDTKGRMTGWDFVMYETPFLARMASEDEKLTSPPTDHFPPDGKPPDGTPPDGKWSPTNKEDLTDYREKLNKEKKETFSSKPSVSDESVSELIDDWNKIPGSEGLPKVSERGSKNPTLRHKIRLRLQEHPDDEFWTRVLNNCWKSPFLRGEKGDWRATLHWLVKNDHNAIQVYEGHYNATR